MHTQKKKNISLFSITLVKKQVGRFCRLNLGKHGAVKVLVAQRGDIRVVKAIPIPLRLIIPVHQTGRYIRKVVTRRRRRTLVHDDADELVQSVRFFAVIGAPLLDIQLKRTGHCCRNLGSLQRRERKQLQMNRHDLLSCHRRSASVLVLNSSQKYLSVPHRRSIRAFSSKDHEMDPRFDTGRLTSRNSSQFAETFSHVKHRSDV